MEQNPIQYPGDNARKEELITFYHKYMYTQDEIRGFLILRHNIPISKTHLRRIIRNLGLRRNQIEAPAHEIFARILELHQSGYVNAGYRAIWRHLNTRCGVRATQETVRLMLRAMDPEGVSLRQRHRLSRRVYASPGPNFIIHIDGYDKLKPFGFAIHGGIDGFSRKVLWLNVLRSNNNPYAISRLYFDYLMQIQCVPKLIRCDAGTENVVVGDVHRALRNFHNDNFSGQYSFLVGRSTANQRIEMFWCFLKKHFTDYWRNLFKDIMDLGLFNTAEPDDIEAARLWFKPVMQNHLDTFKDYWNSHRIRSQRNVDLTTGETPDVMFYQAELFGAHDCSVPLPCSAIELLELANQFSVAEPTWGCSDDFFQRVVEASGIPRQNVVQPTTITDALELYVATKELLT